MSKLLFYKYHTIYPSGPHQQHYVLWNDKVWYKDGDKRWEPIEGSNEAFMMRFVKGYPEHYDEVSALEVLVVCGRGPWDE